MKKLLMLITAIAVMLGGMAFAAPAANATETTASEPVVDLSNILYGSASFDADGSAAAKTSLKTKSGVKIYLNVQVNPMTKNQIKPGTCRKAPIGKRFYNEMVDPATGKHYYKPWRVQAGDNVFCMGTDGVWRKKSCGNKAKGIFGVPKPPKSKIRIKGVVRDYLEYVGQIAANSNLDGSAMAHVVQYDGDKKVCEAKSSISGSVMAMFWARVSVRARSMASMSATSSQSAEASLSTNITVKGELQGKLRTHLEGEAMAWCNYTPPPPPPPPANQPPTGEIVQWPAHLYPGGEYRAKVVGSDPEDGGNVTLDYTVTGGATKLVDANHPEICDVEGSQKVCTFWIKAGQTSGVDATLTLVVRDSEGLNSPTYTKTWPIVADEF